MSPATQQPNPLVLASGSRHRAALLARLGLPFDVVPSDVDERARAGESVRELVARLGREKARAVASRHPGRLIIGSDQSASSTPDGAAHSALGKPGTAAAARAQLQALSGRTVTFLTSLTVLDDHGDEQGAVVETVVRVRSLGEPEIARYVARDDVLDCAGAFRVESLGIALFDSVVSEDPTALIGLPLLRLAAFLRARGMQVP